MVVTVEHSIPMNSRGFFLRERESLNEQYGVQLKFPRGREYVYGNFQTMLMVGLQKDITRMMPQVRRILGEANEQYVAYKDRQASRRDNARRDLRQQLPTVDHPRDKPTTKGSRNAFAALDGLFEQEQQQIAEDVASRVRAANVREEKKLMRERENAAVSNGTAPRPLAVTPSVMNFAAAAAKPAAKPAEKPAMVVSKQNVPAIRTATTNLMGFSWADVVDEEDEDDVWNSVVGYA